MPLVESWSKKLPKAPGYYWVRGFHDPDRVDLVKVEFTAADKLIVVWFFGSDIYLDQHEFRGAEWFWSRPLDSRRRARTSWCGGRHD